MVTYCPLYRVRGSPRGFRITVNELRVSAGLAWWSPSATASSPCHDSQGACGGKIQRGDLTLAKRLLTRPVGKRNRILENPKTTQWCCNPEFRARLYTAKPGDANHRYSSIASRFRSRSSTNTTSSYMIGLSMRRHDPAIPQLEERLSTSHHSTRRPSIRISQSFKHRIFLYVSIRHSLVGKIVVVNHALDLMNTITRLHMKQIPAPL